MNFSGHDFPVPPISGTPCVHLRRKGELGRVGEGFKGMVFFEGHVGIIGDSKGDGSFYEGRGETVLCEVRRYLMLGGG